MPEKKVTVKTIAEDMGISFATVSKALNNSSLVKEETRLAVLKRAHEMGYSPNMMAKGLRSKTTKTIGAIFNDIENVVWVHIFKEISIEMAKFGYTTLIGDGQFSDSVESAAIQSFLSRLPDFIILSPATASTVNLSLLSKMMNRVIILGRRIPGIDCHYIDVNYEIGGYWSACELLKNGHRELLILAGDFALPISGQYVQGIRRAYAEYGVPFEEARLIGEHTSIQNGCDVIRSMWDATQNSFQIPFTGVLTFCDLMAHGVYKGLKELGKRIPDDISIVGFDDNPLSEFSTPALTTVHLPVTKMTDSCLAILKATLLEQSEDIREYTLEPAFRARESVRPR